MRASLPTAAGLLLALLVSSGSSAAASPSIAARDPFTATLADRALWTRDGDHGHGGGHGHGHNPHAQPIIVLNETEIAMSHEPTPPSYYSFDWEGEGDLTAKRHPGLMMAHIVFMSLAFFGALPIGIILRSVRHPAHGVSMLAFYGLAALGVSSAGLYKKMTPNMYQGSVHGKQGYFFLFVALCLSAVDIVAGVTRLVTFFKSDTKTVRQFWRYVILNQADDVQLQGPEYTGLIVEDPEEYEIAKLGRNSHDSSELADGTEQWANEVHRHQSRGSTVSERTLFGNHRSHSSDTLNEATKQGPMTPKAWAKWIGQTAFAIVERTLVVAGFAMVLTGIVVYTGGCRQNWVNGCLAHLIKGGIFWCYGLLTFARFLGSFAELGWAWNRAPSESKYSAEWTESFVIFLYGITNTWMERFGAAPGDPFTTKQVQHISIAVMFWFAGLVGMGIESKRVRRWLASSTFSSVASTSNIPRDAVTEPPSYLASFNPFPALVIGVTGAAMAAHFQTYLFQVEIHRLWGNLLVAFSVLRCFTYFFLWLGPPKSILPSRPPTEALGSFFLACGGLVFMFSTEEVTIAAMRRGRDDVMMFLNVAVAITCLAFCWTLCMVATKGYLKSRSHTSVTFRSSNTSETA
ncbi:hypothetical protein D9611_002369 [Ephemerocybe angulata]|uniref:Uncharacterized protein n=1 Tax=Ephemerocybe angulata TaxID=980116 RepID=A0A8H5FE43_9AGAR|nr:hypothetical protein D9611_002369 [Tulosesus angulatus]